MPQAPTLPIGLCGLSMIILPELTRTFQGFLTSGVNVTKHSKHFKAPRIPRIHSSTLQRSNQGFLAYCRSGSQCKDPFAYLLPGQFPTLAGPGCPAARHRVCMYESTYFTKLYIGIISTLSLWWPAGRRNGWESRGPFGVTRLQTT